MLKQSLIFLALLSAPVYGQEKDPSKTSAGTSKWPNSPYDKVVGYQFANPSHGSLAAFITSKTGAAALEKLKTKEAPLNAKQVEQLLRATFEAKEFQAGGFCYDPHHIFIFYFNDKPVGAIEVCFHCLNTRCWPNNASSGHNDFTSLRSLSSSLGLGTDKPNAAVQNVEMPKPTSPPVPPGLR